MLQQVASDAVWSDLLEVVLRTRRRDVKHTSRCIRHRVTEQETGGVAAETRHALANIGAVLARHGSSIDRVVKVTVMLADMGEWSAMNVEYIKFFAQHLPARSAFGTSGLAFGARVEIECIALAS